MNQQHRVGGKSMQHGLIQPSCTALAALLQQALGCANAEFHAGHVGVHFERALPVVDRTLVLLELKINLAVTGKRAEIQRSALHHFIAIRERASKLSGEKEGGGARVPTRAEASLALDALRKRGNRPVQVTGTHLLDAAGEERVDRFVPRTAP